MTPILPLLVLPQGFDNQYPTLIGLAIVLVLGGFILILARRYKRCPSNKILVIYGKTGEGRSSRCLHGGGAFVWPLIQNYDYLSLDPIQIEIPLQGALSLENIRISVPSVFTVAVGTDGEIMENAAVRLLGLNLAEVSKQAEEIIFGQLRQVIASMRIEEINRDREVFLSKVQQSLEPELAKIGQVLINVNIKDITDESGYIEAIGRKAASEAIQQAEIDVAQQEQKGAIGVSEADKEKMIQVAEREKTRDIGTKTADRERAVKLAELEKEQKRVVGEQRAKFQQESIVRDAEREMRINVADANASAVEGENQAKSKVAYTNADLQTAEAEAYQRGETRRREAEAGVREAQYLAEAKAAEAEGTKIEAEKRAELEASAKAQKAQTIVDAQAVAEKRRIEAEGEAAAIFVRLEAEAKGNYEILAKKGEGMREIIGACGGASEAFQMMMLEHIDHISETAASAIANIKFDKVVVWDGGNGKDGTSSTASFVRSLAGALPPALTMMRDIGGIEMPESLGKLLENVPGTQSAGPVEDTSGDSADEAKSAEAPGDPPAAPE